MIKPQPPDCEFGDTRVEALRKSEHVYAGVVFSFVVGFAAPFNAFFPSGIETEFLADVEVYPFRHHQRLWEFSLYYLSRAQKVAQENNVRVDVAHPGRTGRRLRLPEHIAQQWRAV